MFQLIYVLEWFFLVLSVGYPKSLLYLYGCLFLKIRKVLPIILLNKFPIALACTSSPSFVLMIHSFYLLIMFQRSFIFHSDSGKTNRALISILDGELRDSGILPAGLSSFRPSQAVGGRRLGDIA
jgi:hypothetical protein